MLIRGVFYIGKFLGNALTTSSEAARKTFEFSECFIITKFGLINQVLITLFQVRHLSLAKLHLFPNRWLTNKR